MSDDREQRLVEAIYGECHASPGDEAEAARLRAFREGLAGRLAEVQPSSGLRARLVAEARARAKARRSPWAVWAVRLAPVATVVLVVGVWLTVQPRFDQIETATPEQTAARVAEEWRAVKPPDRAPEGPVAADSKPQVAPALAPATAEAPAPAAAPKAAEVAATTAQPDVATTARPDAAMNRQTVAARRERLQKELAILGAVKTTTRGGGKLSDVLGSGGLGGDELAKALSSPELDAAGSGESQGAVSGGFGGMGRRGGGGSTEGGSGYGRILGSKSAAPAPEVPPKAKGDVGGLGGEDVPVTAAHEEAPRRDAGPVELEEAGPAEPRAAGAAQPIVTDVTSVVAAAPAAEPVVAADADEEQVVAEKKVAAPAASFPAPAKPDLEGSCRPFERALTRATTTPARVDATLALAECRKRAGAPGLARRLLEDLLDDTTLSAGDRDRITEALRGL